MPIYEFVCQDCGNEFEKLQSFSDTSMPICPKCQSVRVQRRLSAPAVHFKGSGWYVTDSKNSGKQSANGKAKEETGEKSSAEPASADKSSSDKGGAEKSEAAKPAEKVKESA
jgi:putative FmdB family regulatory protein